MPHALHTTQAVSSAASGSAIVVFTVYTVAVIALSWFSHRLLQRRKNFLGEY